MPHIITKEFAERLKDHLAGAIDEVDEADALYQELQSLPVLEGEPVGIVVYKPKMLRVGALNQVGLALPDRTKLYTHSAPFTQLQAEVESLRKDAARYQWLSNYLISDETNEDDNIINARSPIQFDCVIDAAIAKDTQEQS
jgi:hypothetical protein